MTESPSRLLEENPDAIANRLMQKAHNRDGLPEIASGLTFLTAAALMWLQVVFHPGSFGFEASSWSFILLGPVVGFGSPWAIKKVRRRFLIERVGYVELKPVNRERTAVVIAIAFVVAAVTAVAVMFAVEAAPPHAPYRGSFLSSSWMLAGTGILGGVLAASSGRSLRYYSVGVLLAAIGIFLAFSRVSLQMGLTILFGSIGLLSLISGSIVLLLFLRQPTEPAQ
jgi:hypothetical protein